MSNDGLRVLEKELGGSAPSGIRSLQDAAVEDLAGAIRDAKRRQAQELAAAGEQALENIPRVLRVPIRKMFR